MWKNEERGPWSSRVILFPSPPRKINWILVLQSSCSLHSTLGVLTAASCSFGPFYSSKDCSRDKLQSWITNGAANSPSPWKWSIKPGTRRRTSQIACHSRRTSQDNPKLRSFSCQFPSSGALLHFGSHLYRRQSSHYFKARSLKQTSFSFISLRHIENYKKGNFHLVLLTQIHILGSFLTRRINCRLP